VIDVTYLLDTPHSFEWKGVYIDADVRAIETVRSSQLGVGSQAEKAFMQISALHCDLMSHAAMQRV